ncbi:hypothetical protein Tco_0216279 [Tanacetum coccineum]
MTYERPPTNPFQNLPNIIYEHDVASLRAQEKRLFGNENIWVEMHPCRAWDKVDNSSPQSTLQVLSSFEEYTPPVTYSKEVDKTIGILMKVEPLEHTKREDLGLNTSSHGLFPISKEFPSVDEPEPQPLPNLPFLDVNQGDKRGTDPPINPYSPGSFRMKIIEPLTIHTPPSPHVAYLHQNGVYHYYHPHLTSSVRETHLLRVK